MRIIIVSLFICLLTSHISANREEDLKKIFNSTSLAVKYESQKSYQWWINALKYPQYYNEFDRQNAVKYFACNFEKIQFFDLNIEGLKAILSSDLCDVDSEEKIFESVQQWIKYSSNDIENDLYELISVIRFPFMSLKFLLTKVEPFYNSFDKTRFAFTEALRWHIMPENRSYNIFYKYKPRTKCNKNFLSVGSYTQMTSKYVEMYDYKANSWTTYTLDIIKHSFSAVILDNKLIIIGGYLPEEKAQKTVESYDFQTKTKTSFASLNEERYYSTAEVLDDRMIYKIIVFGGWGKNDSLKSVEGWNMFNNKWEILSPMKYTRSGCASALLDNKIYIAGGRTVEFGYTNIIEVYDVISNTWHIKESNQNVNAYAGLVATSKYLYLIGGYNPKVQPVSTVERYDFNTNTWEFISNIKSAGQVAVAVFNDTVLSVGGTKNTVELYNENKNVWEQLPPLKYAREGFLLELSEDSVLNW